MRTKVSSTSKEVTRRGFLHSMSGAAFTFMVLNHNTARTYAANSRIEVGCIGLGGRGSMIADMVMQHGGYQIMAVCDYFPAVAQAAGEHHKIPESKRFSGLSGYKRLLATNVDAVFLETPPYCFPDHVEEAVKTHTHIYIAKPLACDVPGCERIHKAAFFSGRQERVFLCDFQTRTDPFFIEGIKRLKNGEIGKIGMLSSEYNDESFADPPKTETIASRLQNLVWVNDEELGGSYLVNAGIHAIDVALWIAGAAPLSAAGSSRLVRANAHGDSHDTYSITYEFADGLILNHRGEHLNNRSAFRCDCIAHCQDGYLESGYTSQVRILGNHTGWRGGTVEDLYAQGAIRNIAAFHQAIMNKEYSNPTVTPSLNATLAAILGREACRRNTKIKWEEMFTEKKSLEVNYTGLAD